MGNKFRFDDDAEKWLEEKGFSKTEKSELLELLGRFENKMRKKEELVILPKNTTSKVASFFDLLYLAREIDGSPACFEKTTVKIPEEVKDRFEESMEIAELEEAEKTKSKTAREHTDPKRRGSKYG